MPGFGEPPRNNQDFEIKILKNQSALLHPSQQQQQQQHASRHTHFRSHATPALIEIKEDHFKKPLTKIDVLKAPDTYPCPLNVYCIQEISINWCLYGGSDFGGSQFNKNDDLSTHESTISPAAVQMQSKNRMNRTVSSPIIVSGSATAANRYIFTEYILEIGI